MYNTCAGYRYVRQQPRQSVDNWGLPVGEPDGPYEDLDAFLHRADEQLDAGRHVDYTADQAEAVRSARGGRHQAAFLIAPTTPRELQAVVDGGELLPQKSTHFYPKLLDGLVFSRLEEG